MARNTRLRVETRAFILFLWAIGLCTLFFSFIYPSLRFKREETRPSVVKMSYEIVEKPKNKLLVLVMSRRESFERRQVIRETWARGHDNLFFVIGAHGCSVPKKNRIPFTCNPSSLTSELASAEQRRFNNKIDQDLYREHLSHKDVVLVDMLDIYRSLPKKLKLGYKFVIDHHPKTDWILKIDDDACARVGLIETMLQDVQNYGSTVVMGNIRRNVDRPLSGKWADLDYKKPKYPPFANGAHGHLVSYDVAQEVVRHNGHEYQGEDVSLGIWLDESKLHVNFVHSNKFVAHGDCRDKSLLVIGHNIPLAKMRQCFPFNHTRLINAAQQIKQINYVEQVNPQSLRLQQRFDIVVKTVYAAFAALEDPVPRFVTAMYERHLKVWNNFQEPCTFKGDKDWFDSRKPCIPKTTAEDFRSSFYATIQSISSNGMDPSISLVPVTTSGFPLNGAHRIAAAIAIGQSSMPIQRAKNSHSFDWTYVFFQQKGLESKYTDFAMLEWTLRFPTTTVVVWPRATAMSSKIAKTRTIVSNEIGGILYETTLSLTRHGLASLVFHAYGEQPWLAAKVDKLVDFDAKSSRFAITVMFVNTPLMKDTTVAKANIRAQYGIQKSSVHVADTHAESKIIAEAVLNANSVQFLNRHDGNDCSVVANELAVRLEQSTVMPSMYLLPQTMMIDSGAVMSFFGLRPRTDVDVLFLSEVQNKLLGSRNGVLVEAHERNHFGIHGHTADDMFFDPSNYGYCHGMKYVSITQMRQYKTNRAVQGKDEFDVAAIDEFLSPTSTTSKPTRISTASRRSSRGGRVMTCGYPKTSEWVARNVFSDFEPVSVRKTKYASSDLLIVGMHNPCPLAKTFQGKVVCVNGEPHGELCAPNSYVLGPMADSAKSVRVYFGALVSFRFPDFKNVVIRPRLRQTKTPEHFLIYTSHNCVGFREAAFDAMKSLGIAFAGGRCHGTSKVKQHNQFPTPPRGEGWEAAVQTYKSFRFALVMENVLKDGYITEKIITAFLGNTIPIYYGTTEVFNLFNKYAFIFYDIHDPQPALDQIAYLETNRTAYAEVVAQPILANGERTLEEYFSLSDDVGGGKLKQRIRDMVLGSTNAQARGATRIQYGSGTYNLDKPTGKVPGSYSWSQVGQDTVIDKLLNGRRDGFFIEIGGYDGELHSNSLFFEQQRGWTGLLVEANPYTYKQMVARDRKCAMVHACISRTLPSMDFKLGGGLTTAIQASSTQHRHRIDNDAKKYGKNKQWEGVGDVVTTKCTTLEPLLQEIGVSHVDYFSLDVEGAELFILESIDWDTMDVDVFTIETQEHSKEIIDFMNRQGYKQLKPSPLQFDEVFVRAASTEEHRHHGSTPPLVDQAIHMVTYGDRKYQMSKQRLVQEADATRWFNTIRAFGPEDLSLTFKQRYHDILEQKRGGGYWLWKLDVMDQTLSTMSDGDIMVYLDAGCSINAKGEDRFHEYVSMLNSSPYDVLSFELSVEEREYTTDHVFRAFEITDVEHVVRTSNQYVATVLVVQKGPHQRKWLALVKTIIERDPWLITDRYNKEAKHVYSGFRDARHDQSLFSVSRKIVESVVLKDDTWPPNNVTNPFWASRKRG